MLHAVEVETLSTLEVRDISMDSRKVTAGSLFIALTDSHDYIRDALQRGAVAVVYEKTVRLTCERDVIPYFAVENLRHKVGLLADEFFNQPSKQMQIFAVTGTNGKTTCCILTAQALLALGYRTAIVGTLGMGELKQGDDFSTLTDSGYTTPDAIALHRQFAQWLADGIRYVCMEVSSHAIDQGRIGGVRFYAQQFTNLSRDHLDYHESMGRYRAVKQRLFSDFPSSLVITNSDDILGRQLPHLANTEKVISYGVSADIQLLDVRYSLTGMTMTLVVKGNRMKVSSQLLGAVNVANVLLVVATLTGLDLPVSRIVNIVANLSPPPGRLELFHVAEKPYVVVDYAHTPDALKRALCSVAEHCKGDMWCVFGCGGDRDKGKRPIMGEIAAQYSDRLIITSDNPRCESAEAIIECIQNGISAWDDDMHHIEVDRKTAIHRAITGASRNDWVVVAGKGHETTQIVSDRRLPMSDRATVCAILEEAA